MEIHSDCDGDDDWDDDDSDDDRDDDGDDYSDDDDDDDDGEHGDVMMESTACEITTSIECSLMRQHHLTCCRRYCSDDDDDYYYDDDFDDYDDAIVTYKKKMMLAQHVTFDVFTCHQPTEAAAASNSRSDTSSTIYDGRRERETTIDDGTALQALHYYSMYASMEVVRQSHILPYRQEAW